MDQTKDTERSTEVVLVVDDVAQGSPTKSLQPSALPPSSQRWATVHSRGGTWTPLRHWSNPRNACYYATLTGIDAEQGLLIGGTGDGNSDLKPSIVKFRTGEQVPLNLPIPLPNLLANHTVDTFDGTVFFILGNYMRASAAPLALVLNRTDGVTASVRRIVFQDPTYYPPSLSHQRTGKFTVARNSSEEGSECEIVVFGGVEKNIANYPRVTNNTYLFNVTDMTWSRVNCPVRPPPRVYHVSCVHENRVMYVYGGAPALATTRPGDDVFGDLWAFDRQKMSWALVAVSGDIPAPRGSAAFVSSGPHLYLYGGFDGLHSFDCMYRFTPATGIWQRLCTPNEQFRNKYPYRYPRWGSASWFSHRAKTLYVSGGFSEWIAADNDEDGCTYELTTESIGFTLEDTSLKLLCARFFATNSDRLRLQ